ncbi:MAG TPA: nuclear transport factor 2 family protein [Burkholderiales bacterium]|nr:nuclear transport factor 2 family protein [Burkholderiales bacterium]
MRSSLPNRSRADVNALALFPLRPRPLLLLALAGVFAINASSAQAQQPQTNATTASTEATPQANIALIKSAYDAFSRGDIAAVTKTFAEDISWHVPGRGPLSRDYRGHAEVLGFFDHFMRLSNGTFQLRVDDILAAGDRVVVLCTESAQRGGRSWTSPNVHVWTIRDGKATAFWEYEGDQQSEDEFWSSPG